MNRKLFTFLGLALLLFCSAAVQAKPREKGRAMPFKTPVAAKATLDTVFFDNFETDTMGWSVTDMAVQPPYWHIDTYNAYSGRSFWCGTATDVEGWVDPPGYGDGWAQFLISPEIDLSAVTADSIVLTYWQNNRLEAPDPGDDWDCINVWITTVTTDSSWNFDNWIYIFPDTIRYPGTGYNVDSPYSWKYIGLVPDGTYIPGWGGIKDWHRVAFDLSAYKGQKVKLAFIGTSDAAQSDQSHQSAVNYHGMWYLDNIAVDTVTAGGNSGHAFFEDCEAGMGDWYAHSKVPQYFWHRTNRMAYSPTTSWWNGNESTGKYKWGQSDAMTSPVIDLSEVRNTDACYADFKTWLDIPDDGTDPNGLNDWYKIEFSADSGRNWVDNFGINIDASKTWVDHSTFYQVNLANYIGKTVMIRIGVGTDGDNNVGEGMYVDDFIVWGKTRDPLPPASTICLVDNDGSAADISDNSWTKYMESSMANLGYKYSLVTIGGNKVMTPGYLEQYPVVIWNLGSNFDYRAGKKELTVTDQACILSYLNNGGNLWMSGQYFFFANGTQLDTTVHPNFWMDYLHLAPEDGWAPQSTYRGFGAAGDPIGDGLSDSLFYDRLNGNSVWTNPDRGYFLNPDTANYPVAGFMSNDYSNFIGLRYHDAGLGYNLVYTSFPFEAVPSPENRDTLMSRVINWLRPGLDGDYMPPAVPQGLALTQSYDTVKCAWRANSEADIKGYNVFRSLQSGIPTWTKVGTVLAPDTVYADTAVQSSLTYNYALTAYDTLVPANESLKSRWSRIYVLPWKLGIEGQPVSVIPARFSLEQNKPNPFKGNTEIQFALPNASRVELGVYNVAGQKVASLASGSYPAGYHSIRWNGRDGQGRLLSNGVYFYRLEARGQNGQERLSQTKRLIIVK
jgi:hypothetical protein